MQIIERENEIRRLLRGLGFPNPVVAYGPGRRYLYRNQNEWHRGEEPFAVLDEEEADNGAALNE